MSKTPRNTLLQTLPPADFVDPDPFVVPLQSFRMKESIAIEADFAYIATVPNMDRSVAAGFKQFLRHKELVGDLRAKDIVEELCPAAAGSHPKRGVPLNVRHIPTQVRMSRLSVPMETAALRKRTARALRALHEWNFPHVQGFFGSYHSDAELSICVEFMDAGSLEEIGQRAGRIPEPVLGKVTAAVLKALIYLQTKNGGGGHVHGAVRPTNVLVNSSGEIKLGGCFFGANNTHLVHSLGNLPGKWKCYAAPEECVQLLQTLDAPYLVQSDVWSLGVSLIEMSIGMFPIPPPDVATLEQIFGSGAGSPDAMMMDLTQNVANVRRAAAAAVVQNKSMPIFALMEHIVNEPPPQLEQRFFGADFRDFVERCLQKDPAQRADLAALMSHPWIQKADTDDDVDIGRWIRRAMELPAPSE